MAEAAMRREVASTTTLRPKRSLSKASLSCKVGEVEAGAGWLGAQGMSA